MVNAANPSASRLARSLYGDADGPRTDELAGWIAGSARFRDFADAHRDKIRKKLRAASDDASGLDVRTELRVAHALLADRRIELAFEPRGSTRGGPDFSVAFRSHPACFLEVTRLRAAPDAASLARVVVTKLRQLPPALPTVLLISVDASVTSDVALTAAVREVRSRADAGDPAILSLARLEGRRAFYQRFLRLGAVLAWAEMAPAPARVAAWINPSAQLVVPRPAITACMEMLRA